MWQKNSEERERNSKINSLAYMKSDSFTYFACWFRIGFSSLFQAFIGGGGGRGASQFVRCEHKKKHKWKKARGELGREREMFPPFSRPISSLVNFSHAP